MSKKMLALSRRQRLIQSRVQVFDLWAQTMNERDTQRQSRFLKRLSTMGIYIQTFVN